MDPVKALDRAGFPTAPLLADRALTVTVVFVPAETYALLSARLLPKTVRGLQAFFGKMLNNLLQSHSQVQQTMFYKASQHSDKFPIYVFEQLSCQRHQA